MKEEVEDYRDGLNWGWLLSVRGESDGTWKTGDSERKKK
jgi:hypothetical protein